ncbi:MAG: F0F1 ATP synthase subunit B [Elainella sp.]
MESLILLTAEAAEEGFGLNLNILQTNLINLAVVVSVVVYFGRNILGKTLQERRSSIEATIQEAEQKQKQAAAGLAEQQQKLAQAQAEAQRIKADAEERAKAAKAAILAQAAEDIERMKASAAQDLNTQQERILNELRQRVATLAVQQAEAQMRSELGSDRQSQLIDRSIALIGGA